MSVETEKHGGIFTFSFLKALERAKSAGKFPTYSELFSTTKSILKSSLFKNINDQTPQIEYSGNLSPYDTLLGLGEKQLFNLPEVVFRDNNWKIGVGAIHGALIPEDPNFTINVYSKAEKNGGEVLVREGSVKPVALEVEYMVVKELTTDLNPQEVYFAEFTGDKLPLYINEKSENSELKKLILEELKRPLYKSSFQLEEKEETVYQLWLTENTIEIRKEGELIYGVKDHSKEAVKHMCDWLGKIAKWEQVYSLKNPRISTVDTKDLSLVLEHYEYTGEKVKFVSRIKDDEEELNVFETRMGYNKDIGGKPYAFEAHYSGTRELYFYLIHLDRFYGINQVHENFQIPYNLDKVLLYDSMGKKVFGIGDKSPEAKNVFLLIASRIKLEAPYILEQASLGARKGKILSAEDWRKEVKRKSEGMRSIDFEDDSEVRAFTGMLANWCVIRLEVRVMREGTV